jgi:predicted RNA-binding protein with RPS1 domain
MTTSMTQQDEFGRSTSILNVVVKRRAATTATTELNDEETIWKQRLLEKQRMKRQRIVYDCIGEGDSRNGRNKNPDNEDDDENYNRRTDDTMDNRSEFRQVSAATNTPTLQVGMIVQGRVTRLESYGAFVELKHQNGKRGLIHISQLQQQSPDSNTNGFIHNVQDVVRVGQELYVSIIEIESNNKERISLSMKGINQETGEYDTSIAASNENRRDQNHPRQNHHHHTVPPHLLRRADDRRKLLEQQAVSWMGNKVSLDDHPNSRPTTTPSPSWLRLLWSASPEPPLTAKTTTTNPSTKSIVSNKRSQADDDDSNASSSSSSSESSSSSSESSRRHRSRKKRSSNRRHRTSSRRDSRRRISRKKKPRSGSTSSSSSDDRSSSSSSSSNSGGNDDETKSSLQNRLEQDHQPKGTGINDDSAKIDINDIRDAEDFKASVQGKHTMRTGEDDDDDYVGPQPLPMSNASLGTGSTATPANYGKALLPGEGQALAQYVQQNQRIPRRGEIGYTCTEIERYEQSGFVMSGSRHAKMNAVRLRKENQVYSAEEKRALALITMEEQKQQEAGLMEDFRKMLQEKERKREEQEKRNNSK